MGKKREIIISNSTIPFIRAGIGNLNLFFLLIWISFGYQILATLHFFIWGSIIYLVGILYFIRNYVFYVSKIVFDSNKILFITSVFPVTVSINKIDRIKISALSISAHIDLKIKIENIPIRLVVNFPGGATNFGDLKHTLAAIEEMFQQYNIPYKKNINLLELLKKKKARE